MDFKDNIKQLADRVVKLRDSILTEEATKNAFIMPFINTLGYDVFNPLEVVPEMTCDIAMKKGEKNRLRYNEGWGADYTYRMQALGARSKFTR